MSRLSILTWPVEDTAEVTDVMNDLSLLDRGQTLMFSTCHLEVSRYVSFLLCEVIISTDGFFFQYCILF